MYCVLVLSLRTESRLCICWSIMCPFPLVPCYERLVSLWFQLMVRFCCSIYRSMHYKLAQSAIVTTFFCCWISLLYWLACYRHLSHHHSFAGRHVLFPYTTASWQVAGLLQWLKILMIIIGGTQRVRSTSHSTVFYTHNIYVHAHGFTFEDHTTRSHFPLGK